MAGAKFQYDESGGTFFYFLLAFLALVVLPSTYYLWPQEEKKRKPQDSKKCRCEACQIKASRLEVTHPWKKTKQNTTKVLILLGWVALAACAYKVANLEDTTYVKWDPFEILEIDPASSTADIKKAYRRLSLKHHPDREGGDDKKFMMIAKAYAALTDEEARKNWEQYGNPDGPGAMSFGIALPSWIVEKEYSIFVLGAYTMVFMIALPVIVGMWWYRSAKYGEDLELLLETSHLFVYFINKTGGLMQLRRVVMLICAALDFDRGRNPDIIQRPTDEDEIPALIKKIPEFGEKNRERPLCFEYSLKARSLLYAHLMRIPISEGLQEDQRYILKKCPALLQEFVNCCAHLTMLALCGRLARFPKTETLENAMKLCQLIVQAQWDPRSSLTQLPHVTEEMLRRQPKRNQSATISQVREMTESRRRELFKALEDDQYDDVIRVLRQMPSIDVSVKVEVVDDEDEGLITADAMVTLTATLVRKRPEEVLNVEDAARCIKSEMNAAKVADDAMLNGDVSGAVDGTTPDAESNVEKKEAKPKVWQKKPLKKTKPKKKPQTTKKVIKIVKTAVAEANPETETTQIVADKQDSSQPPSESGAGDGAVGGGSEVESSRRNSTSDEDQEGGDQIEEDRESQPSTDGRGGSVKDEAGGDEEEEDDWHHVQSRVPKKAKDLEKKPKQSHSVHAPFFPDDKQEFWWVYLVEKKTRKLMTVPFLVTSLVDEEDAILKFSAPSKPGQYQYVLHVRSDSYYRDFDVQKIVKFQVHEAKAFVPPPQWNEVDEDSEEGKINESDESAVSDSDLADTTDDESD